MCKCLHGRRPSAHSLRRASTWRALLRCCSCHSRIGSLSLPAETRRHVRTNRGTDSPRGTPNGELVKVFPLDQSLVHPCFDAVWVPQVVHVDARCFLAESGDAADALLETSRVPGTSDVDGVASALEIDALDAASEARRRARSCLAAERRGFRLARNSWPRSRVHDGRLARVHAMGHEAAAFLAQGGMRRSTASSVSVYREKMRHAVPVFQVPAQHDPGRRLSWGPAHRPRCRQDVREQVFEVLDPRFAPPEGPRRRLESRGLRCRLASTHVLFVDEVGLRAARPFRLESSRPRYPPDTSSTRALRRSMLRRQASSDDARRCW